MHVVFYEDIVRNMSTEIRKIAEFLNITITSTMLAKIVEEAQFQAMRKNIGTNFSLSGKPFSSKFSYIRKGQIGAWKDYFTIAQNEWMDAHIANKLRNVDVVLQYG